MTIHILRPSAAFTFESTFKLANAGYFSKLRQSWLPTTIGETHRLGELPVPHEEFLQRHLGTTCSE